MLRMSFRKGRKGRGTIELANLIRFWIPNPVFWLLAKIIYNIYGVIRRRSRRKTWPSKVGQRRWNMGYSVMRVNMKLIWDMEAFKCKYQ